SVEGEGHSRDEVYNVDETGVNWKALPRKSLASKRKTTAPGLIVSKERVTAMSQMIYAHKEVYNNQPDGVSKVPSNTRAELCRISFVEQFTVNTALESLYSTFDR
ncbi:hypothetical protein TNIN_49231, partial [Trichonephila inaurata madagascariensis]